jgi:very-short-patch-repair endonuclease
MLLLPLTAMYRDQDQRNFARGLRNEMTPAEQRLWRHLRAQQLHGHEFRRQVAIGAYIVDFVCLKANLIVELDGPQHLEPEALQYDANRTAWLKSIGYRVLRFRNHQLDEEVQSVVDGIVRAPSEKRRDELGATYAASSQLIGIK